MFLRHVTGFQSFSRKYGRISNGTLERSLLGTNPRVSTTTSPTNFHAFTILFRHADGPIKMAFKSSSLLIQRSSLRRNKNVSTSVIYNPLDLMSRYSIIRVLSRFHASTMSRLARETSGYLRPTHQTRKPFYITPCRQENPASRENYASELHQVMIMCLSRVGRTSCEKMAMHGRVHFILFQNIIFLCMKN